MEKGSTIVPSPSVTAAGVPKPGSTRFPTQRTVSISTTAGSSAPQMPSNQIVSELLRPPMLSRSVCVAPTASSASYIGRVTKASPGARGEYQWPW